MQLLDLHQSEKQNQGTGGHIVSQARRSNQELAYQRKAEHCTTEENCFKVVVSQVCLSILLNYFHNNMFLILFHNYYSSYRQDLTFLEKLLRL